MLDYCERIEAGLSLTFYCKLGSGCGSAGRAVASDTRGPRFDAVISKIYIEHLYTCVLSTVFKRQKLIKRGREWPI